MKKAARVKADGRMVIASNRRIDTGAYSYLSASIGFIFAALFAG